MKRIILLLIIVFSLLSITQNAGAFQTISGTLEQGSCKKDFSIDGITVFFGPYRYIRSTTALFDYDGDDDIETIYNELCGLVLKGEKVTLEGWYKHDDFFNVFTINGMLYRESGPPPWT